MRVYELEYPGTWIKLYGTETDQEIYHLVLSLESSFTEAAVSLNLYEAARKKGVEEISTDSETRLKNFEGDRDKRRKLELAYEAQIASEQDSPLSFDQRTEMYNRVEKELKREKWNSGEMPKVYKHALVFIYAKAFVSNIDMIGKIFRVICKDYQNLPQGVYDQKDNFFRAFPQLKDIRDSLQHAENRNRGFDRYGNPLNIQPGVKGHVQTSGQSLVLNNLNGNKFGTTINDGRFVDIEITDQTMKIVQQCLQELIYSFNWVGSGKHYPS